MKNFGTLRILPRAVRLLVEFDGLVHVLWVG